MNEMKTHSRSSDPLASELEFQLYEELQLFKGLSCPFWHCSIEDLRFALLTRKFR